MRMHSTTFIANGILLNGRLLGIEIREAYATRFSILTLQWRKVARE